MSEWLVFAAGGVVMVVLVMVARMLARLEINGFKVSEIEVEAYTRGALCFVAQRATPEAVFTELCRPSDKWDEEIELCESRHGSYSRIAFEFPGPLHLGIRILSENEDGFVNRLRRMREVEIGHARFDHAFLVFAHDADRLSQIFDEELRDGFVKLAELVDDFRLTDNGALLVVDDILEPAELEELTAHGQEVIEKYYARGRDILEEARRQEEEGDASRRDHGAFRLPMQTKKPG